MIESVTIRVDGMSCAACSARIEKALSKVEGVSESYANFTAGRVSVTYDADVTDRETLEKTIESAGYTIVRKDTVIPDKSKSILISLLVCIVFSIPVVVLSMGSMAGLEVDIKISAAVQLILSIPVVIAGRRFFLRGIPALIARSPTMDTLVALGSGTAFVYSVFLTVEIFTGGTAHLYYESAVMIITLVSVGKYLESRSRERTDDAVKGLKKLAPEEANVIEDGKETVKRIDELKVGDILIIRPGERIPTDSRVTEGNGSADESMLTGESIPVDKTAGDALYGGTVNTNGSMRAEVAAVGDDTVLSKIINAIEETQSTKAPIARLADRVARVFVPAVITIAIVACVLWLIAGKDIAFGLTILISVLVISCPCAMGLATPMAITVGTGKAAEYGILFKDAASLERSGKVNAVLFDKTGTITEGKPAVSDYYPDENVILTAAVAEYDSEHPIAKAITDRASSLGFKVPENSDFISSVGSGVSCISDGHKITVGNRRMMESENIEITFPDEAEKMASKGCTVVYAAKDGIMIGIIGISDSIRQGSVSAVSNLKNMGISVGMVTGDAEAAAYAVASEVGVTDVTFGALPEDKIKAVKKLQAVGKDVAVAGDGINDAPALIQSDLGIAVASGTDIAMDSADVVLMNDDIGNVVTAIEIGRATLKNVRENLFWAFCYNVVCIPVAAGLPYLFGLSLMHQMPMISAAAMSLSSLCVVTNALRLKRFRPKSETANPSR